MAIGGRQANVPGLGGEYTQPVTNSVVLVVAPAIGFGGVGVISGLISGFLSSGIVIRAVGVKQPSAA